MSLAKLKRIRNNLQKLKRIDQDNTTPPNRKTMAKLDRESSALPDRRTKQSLSPTRKSGIRPSRREVSPTRSRHGRSYSPPRKTAAVSRGRSPARSDKNDRDIYCVYCKRKTPTRGLVLKVSSNNRKYYSGECDICHKKKAQFTK
jgi:hypothetical protein